MLVPGPSPWRSSPYRCGCGRCARAWPHLARPGRNTIPEGVLPASIRFAIGCAWAGDYAQSAAQRRSASRRALPISPPPDMVMYSSSLARVMAT